MKRDLFHKLFVLLFVLSLGTMAKGQTADLVITNAVTHHQASGQFTNFIITIRNNGPNTATNVKVTDVLTTAWNFANPASNHKASHGTLNTSGTQNRNLEWNIPYIPNGGVAVLIFRATNNNNDWDNPPYTTTASITGMNQTDPNLSNNSATTTSTNGSTSTHSLSLVQTVNNLTPNVGDLVQFTISLNRINAGTSVALQVTDKLPPGFSYQNHTVSNGTYNSSTGIWNLTENSHYFSSNPHTLVINATVLPPTGAPDEYKNIAAITSVALDVDIANDMSIVSVAPLSALPPEAVNDNAVTVQNFPVNINLLSNDVYSTLDAIAITQQPANGQNITVNGLTDVTYTPNNGYTGTDSFKYTITDENGISGEATVNLDVVPVVAPTAVADAVSAIKNETKIINVLVNDNQGSGAFDEVAIVSQPTHGDVIVNPDNTVSYTPNTNYTGTDSFQYEVTNIHNTTSNTATASINVLDPVGLVTWNGAGGNFAPNVTATHITASNLTNHGGGTLVANNWPPNQNFEVGSWPATLNESRYVQFTITANSNYKIDLNRFNVEIQMNGGGANSASYELRYSKDFEEGYSSINGTISGNGEGVWDSKSWNLSDANTVLPEETLYIRLYIYNTYNTLKIRNSWGGSTGPTITGAVNQYVTADPADLKITKTMDNDIPDVGDNVVYTIVVENLDPSNTASGVVVIDQLPAGFEYVSDDSGGSYDEGTGIWNIGGLANGDSATLEITAEKQASGPYTNTASVSHNGTDSNPSNDSSSVTPSNACANCTHTVSGGTITVNAGEIYCLHSGSWSGGVTMNGGTICIGEGATFNTAHINGNLNGMVINHGTMTFNLNTGSSHNIIFENAGIFNTTNLQNFAGTLNNTGSIQMTSGNATFLSGAKINNYGEMKLRNVSANNTIITNSDSFIVNDNFYLLNGGSFENKASGTVSLNMTNGNTEIRGQFTNSGFVEIRNANAGQGISTVVNNYGTMKIYDNVILGSATYLTNDHVLEFINIASVEFQGPMLQNNKRLIVTAGNLSLNSPISQMVNNDLVIVSGAVSHNIAGSKVVNSCRIVAGSYFVGNGTTENKGLIWVTEEFKVEGMLSKIKNDLSGFIRGADFRNSGEITGYGSFYFTGITNFQSAGTIIGDDANNPILFYDVSQTGNQIFDVDVADNPPINLVRPASMILLDTLSFDCGIIPPSVAGHPPTTMPLDTAFCEPSEFTFSLDSLVAPHEPEGGLSFTVLYNSVKLFEKNNMDNPTNNDTTLVILDKGVFTYNTLTKSITFNPDPTFTNGTVEAEYIIYNSWSGTPPVTPSPRTGITITITPLLLQPITGPEGTLCIGQTLTLANDSIGGTWTSSTTGVATVDASGLVTGLAAGTTTITYTVDNGICEKFVTQDITVQSCTPISIRKVISNPMLRNRAKTN